MNHTEFNLRLCTYLLTLFVSLAHPGLCEEVQETSTKETWQKITNQGQRIGYAHSTQSSRQIDGQTIVQTDILTMMKISRFGQVLTIRQIQHFEETPDGKLLRFTSTTENPPGTNTTVSGEINGDRLTTRSNTATNNETQELMGVKGIASPVWHDRLIEQGKLKKGETTTILCYEPQLGKVMKVHLTYSEDIETESQKLQRKVLTKQEFEGFPPIAATVFCDEDWTIRKVITPLVNMELETTTAEVALAPIGEIEFDFAVDTMIPVKDLKAPQTAKSIRYRIKIEGINPAEIFKESPCQFIEVVPEENNTILMTVTDRPREGTNNISFDQASRSRSLQATQFLQCDDALIQKLAQEASDSSLPGEIARQLEKFVQNYVTQKNFSTAMATASDVARTRSGDCTEHAVLLTAMLRARKIPSRVVIGFVFSDRHQAFVGHMWSEAWIAEEGWIPLDATTGKGRTGCGYLSISTSNLSDQGSTPAAEFLPMLHLMGQTKIDVDRVIR